MLCVQVRLVSTGRLRHRQLPANLQQPNLLNGTTHNHKVWHHTAASAMFDAHGCCKQYPNAPQQLMLLGTAVGNGSTASSTIDRRLQCSWTDWLATCFVYCFGWYSNGVPRNLGNRGSSIDLVGKNHLCTCSWSAHACAGANSVRNLNLPANVIRVQMQYDSTCRVRHAQLSANPWKSTSRLSPHAVYAHAVCQHIPAAGNKKCQQTQGSDGPTSGWPIADRNSW
jgi:hypothetical protein